MPGLKRKAGGRSTAGQGSRKRRSTMRARRSTYSAGPKRVMLRGVVLPAKRMVTGSSPLTFSTVATNNFHRYVSVSLDNGFVNFASGTTICSLTNKAEYGALFEQYRLSSFRITLRPRYSNYNVTQGAAATLTSGVDIPYLCIVKDPYNTVVPTLPWAQSSLNTLLEQGGKIYRADRPITIYMRPKVTEQFGSGATRYISPAWTDISTGSAVEHRGFHMFAFTGSWNNAALTQNAWDVYVTYYLQFKNPK